MKACLLFLLLAALGNATYHLGQKTLPQGSNPMAVLMAVYALAFLMSALALPLFAGGAGVPLLRQVASWPVLALAVGVFLIELGFLLAYRSGASLQWSGSAVNGVSALLLVPIALLVFKEAWAPGRLLGILLTLGGLFLMARH
nr:hypothetical protein [uncultured Holophaga sp.]